MPRHYSTAAAPVQWAQRPNFPVFSAGFLPIIPMRKLFSACCPKKGNPPAIFRKIPGTGRGSPPDGKKRLPDATASGSPGGGWWIRTTEGVASRFTVCPLWPLGNLPISFRTICALTVIDYITSIFSPQAFYVKISSSFPAFPANCSKTSALFFQFHRVPAIIFVILDIQLILSHII